MAKKDTSIVEEIVNENISIEPLEDVMSSRYATYAKYVIQDRAIPDVRDGLKPVQRRIIYTMYKTGNIFNRPTKKCAHTVGAVMGTYHPHGDTSIYDALSRMSQDWKMRIPLIDFQGNNGSIDGDMPAAYRYTESRLAKISNELIRDIEKNVVDMQLNFDDTELEPVVLPSRFPNLLLNGTEGIAVALATEIPPHNLGELIDAIIYRINHKNVTISDLMQFVKGPDFPGGGIIYDSQGLKDIYETGRGRIEIAGKTSIVEQKNINQIIISEIPYKVVKKNLAFEIDKIKASKVINGILEVRDESAMSELRIVVDLKKDARADLILKYLMNKTELKLSYSANMVAIINGKPKTINLLDYIDAYIAHQKDVVSRVYQYDLAKAKARLHIVEGLIIATININDVIELIKHSKDKEDAKQRLMDKYNLSKEQTEAIVMMPLYKLSNTDTDILNKEKIDLSKMVGEYEAVLNDPLKLNKVIIKDLKSIKDLYGDVRRTEIREKEETQPLNKRDLITKEDVMVVVTHDGYIKRSTLKSVKGSGENALPGLKDGDLLVAKGIVSTKDYLICFTNQGNYLSLPVHVIQENKWKEEGVHINSYSAIGSGEKIIKVINVTEMRNDLYLALLTKFGQIKRMALNNIELDKRSRPSKCMKLLTGDELISVCLLTGNSDLLVLTNNGYASLYNENELSIIGLKTGGVKSILGLGKVHAVGLLSFDEEEKSKVLLVTDKGHKRIFDNNKIGRTARLGKTTCIMPIFKSSPHKIIAVSKIVKGQNEQSLNLKFKDNTSDFYKFTDFHVDDISKYAKKDMNTPNTIIIKAYDGVIEYVNGESISHPTTIKDKQNSMDLSTNTNGKNEQKNKEEDKAFEQISIFDDLDN